MQLYRKTEILISASKEVGLEINIEKTRYTCTRMLLSRQQNVGQNRDIKIAMCRSSNIRERQ
jgi:hypothetical protein